MKIDISVANLRTGMIMAVGKGRIPVVSIEPCKAHRKGVPRYHVNKSNCYDTIGTVTIIVKEETS